MSIEDFGFLVTYYYPCVQVLYLQVFSNRFYSTFTNGHLYFDFQSSNDKKNCFVRVEITRTLVYVHIKTELFFFFIV